MTFDEAFALLGQSGLAPEQRIMATVETTLATLDARMHDALEAAAVPHSFNAPILARLLNVELPEAEVLTEELARLSFVETFRLRGGWNVHKLVRLAVRQKLLREDPERFRLFSSRAAVWSYGDEFVSRVEAIYHGLSSKPEKTADELEQTYLEWERAGRLEALHMLATTLEELRNFPLEAAARAPALVYLGWIRLYRYPLDKSEELAREALRSIPPEGPRSVQSNAHILLGRVLERRGKAKEALTHFQTGKKLLAEALATNTANLEIKRDLAIAHTLIGRIYSSSGTAEDALDEFAEAQRILGELIAFQPFNPTWKRELSVTYNDVGRIHEGLKDFSRALEAFQADKSIAENLAAAEPGNPERKRDLAVSYNNTGRLFMEQGMFAEALEDYQTYHKITQDLVAVDSSNRDWQRELSVALQCLGNAYRALERGREAITAYDGGKRILLGLTELDPGNAGWQRDLSMVDERMGRTYRDQKLFPESLASFERSKEILERLLAQEPDNVEWLRGLSFVYHHMGRTYEAQGNAASALSSFQNDLAIAEGLAAIQPSSTARQDDVRVSREAVERVRALKRNTDGDVSTS